MIRKKSAFTLIELLVVVAIIAILFAIIAPVINRARSGQAPTPSSGPVYESPTTRGDATSEPTWGNSGQTIELLPGQKFIAFETKEGVRVPITEERDPKDPPKRHQVTFDGQRITVIER